MTNKRPVLIVLANEKPVLLTNERHIPDCPQCEAEAPGPPPDDDGRLEGVYQRRHVATRAGVTTGGGARTPGTLHTLKQERILVSQPKKIDLQED